MVAAGAGPHPRQQRRAEQEGGGVEDERLPGADGQHERGTQRRPDKDRHVGGRL